MKLLINGKYEEVGLWSFVKCSLITYAIIALGYFAVMFIVGLISGLMS